MQLRTLHIEPVISCESTNDLVAKAAAQGQAEAYAVIAEEQTAGRGRAGRQWQSLVGNLHTSLLLRPNVALAQMSSLPLLAGLCWQQYVQSLLPKANVQVKWPNDLWIDGKKCAGLLMERGNGYVILGMGVNVAHAPLLADAQTSSLNDYDVTLSPIDVLEGWWKHFEPAYERWLAYGFKAFMSEWDAATFEKGTAVTVYQDTAMCGAYAGVSESGALLLAAEHGGVSEVYAGDVSLRLSAEVA